MLTCPIVRATAGDFIGETSLMAPFFYLLGDLVKTRLIATTIVAGALVLGAQTSAFAADYTGVVSTNAAAPGGLITYSSTDTDQPAGTVGTASLTGNLAAEEGAIIPASTLTTSVTTGANGDLNFQIKLPTSAPAGSTYTLDVAVGTFNDAVSLEVAAVPADTAAGAATGTGSSSGSLPSTGVDATPYVWFGGGLLVLGAGLVSVLAYVRRSKNA
jgi:LPXTG-motif cell wall-anchored protein